MGRCNISKEIWNGTTRCLGVPNSSTLKKGIINHFMRSFNKNVWHQKGSTCLSVLAPQDGDKLPLPQQMVRSQRAGTGNQVLRAPRYLLPPGDSECRMINQLETKCTRSSILTVTALSKKTLLHMQKDIYSPTAGTHSHNNASIYTSHARIWPSYAT